MVTPDVGVQGKWRTPATGQSGGMEESPWTVPGPTIDVFGIEIAHPTAARAGVRMDKASLICAIEPTIVPLSKNHLYQMSGYAVAGLAWCASVRPTETFSVAFLIPMAKRRGPGHLVVHLVH